MPFSSTSQLLDRLAEAGLPTTDAAIRSWLRNRYIAAPVNRISGSYAWTDEEIQAVITFAKASKRKREKFSKKPVATSV